MTIASICCREVDVADPKETVRAAAQRMASRNVGTLLVIDERRRPIGILTDRDVALRVTALAKDPNATNVREAMTKKVRAVSETASIEGALERMRRYGVRRLAVVDSDKTLVGILSLDDLLAHLFGELRVLGGILRHSAPEGVKGR